MPSRNLHVNLSSFKKSNNVAKIANLSYNSDDADSNAQYAMMEVDHKKKIKEISDEFDEMIRFMDTSFEKAFDKKEKDFMLAYRVILTIAFIPYRHTCHRYRLRLRLSRVMGIMISTSR